MPTVRKVVLHPNYNPRTEANDIALIKLNSPVTFNNYVQPACLPHVIKDSKTSFSNCFISGWGTTAQNSVKTSDALQEARVNLLDTKKCNSSEWYKGAMSPHTLCAGYEEGGIDSCQGDSGGPLMCRVESSPLYYVIGITSWGKGCAQANNPGIYTATKHYLEWILAAMMEPEEKKSQNLLEGEAQRSTLSSSHPAGITLLPFSEQTDKVLPFTSSAAPSATSMALNPHDIMQTSASLKLLLKEMEPTIIVGPPFIPEVASPPPIEPPYLPPEKAITLEAPYFPEESPPTPPAPPFIPEDIAPTPLEPPYIPHEVNVTLEPPYIPPDNLYTAPEPPYVPPEPTNLSPEPIVPKEDFFTPSNTPLSPNYPFRRPETDFILQHPYVHLEAPPMPDPPGIHPEAHHTMEPPYTPTDAPPLLEPPYIPPETAVTLEPPYTPMDTPVTLEPPFTPPETPLHLRRPYTPSEAPYTAPKPPYIPPQAHFILEPPYTPPDTPPTLGHPYTPSEFPHSTPKPPYILPETAVPWKRPYIPSEVQYTTPEPPYMPEELSDDLEPSYGSPEIDIPPRPSKGIPDSYDAGDDATTLPGRLLKPSK